MGVSCHLACPPWTQGERLMLLYDSFSIRHLRVEVLLYPPSEDRFPEGVLSRLYASLNADDMFDDCALRQRLGAIFEGERLTYDIETRRIRMHFRNFGTIQESKENLNHLLGATKKVLNEAGMRFLYLTDEV